MTPARMAEIHRASFETPRPWEAREFAAMADMSGAFLCLHLDGFLWGRSIADEAELLTLAVAPAARGAGVGSALVENFLHTAAMRGAQRVFLEVAEDNAPARRLYARHGFVSAGRRRGYYTSPDGRRMDALVLTKSVNGKAGKSG